MSIAGDILGGEARGTIGSESGVTLGDYSGSVLVCASKETSYWRALMVGWPRDKKDVAGARLLSLCLRSSKAAAILSGDDAEGNGNF